VSHCNLQALRRRRRGATVLLTLALADKGINDGQVKVRPALFWVHRRQLFWSGKLL